jgi:hypothetical protein
MKRSHDFPHISGLSESPRILWVTSSVSNWSAFSSIFEHWGVILLSCFRSPRFGPGSPWYNCRQICNPFSTLRLSNHLNSALSSSLDNPSFGMTAIVGSPLDISMVRHKNKLHLELKIQDLEGKARHSSPLNGFGHGVMLLLSSFWTLSIVCF